MEIPSCSFGQLVRISKSIRSTKTDKADAMMVPHDQGMHFDLVMVFPAPYRIRTLVYRCLGLSIVETSMGLFAIGFFFSPTFSHSRSSIELPVQPVVLILAKIQFYCIQRHRTCQVDPSADIAASFTTLAGPPLSRVICRSCCEVLHQ